MSHAPPVPDVDVETLRCEIRNEYAEVAENPGRGFHFHTGRRLAKILGYDEALLDAVPESAIESFAGTGNPFSLGEIQPGAHVVDIGSGADAPPNPVSFNSTRSDGAASVLRSCWTDQSARGS